MILVDSHKQSYFHQIYTYMIFLILGIELFNENIKITMDLERFLGGFQIRLKHCYRVGIV